MDLKLGPVSKVSFQSSGLSPYIMKIGACCEWWKLHCLYFDFKLLFLSLFVFVQYIHPFLAIPKAQLSSTYDYLFDGKCVYCGQFDEKMDSTLIAVGLA